MRSIEDLDQVRNPLDQNEELMRHVFAGMRDGQPVQDFSALLDQYLCASDPLTSLDGNEVEAFSELSGIRKSHYDGRRNRFNKLIISDLALVPGPTDPSVVEGLELFLEDLMQDVLLI